MKLMPLLLSLFTIAFTGTSECHVYSVTCGRVVNNTPYAMKWADLGANHGYCQLFNSHAGPTSSSARVTCTQYPLAAHSSKGGRTHDRIDVDAFCFTDRGYWVKFGKQPGEHYIGAGEWVKISDDETATCTASGGVVHCKVEL